MQKIKVIKATLEDYPLIQNMARFYVYDLSRTCGAGSPDWALPATGFYESFDFKNYFTESSRYAYLIKVGDEVAGFALLYEICEESYKTWVMGEFFVMARFQQQGIGQQSAFSLWERHSGRWEISVIPENKPALGFWQKTVNSFTCGVFDQSERLVAYDTCQPRRVVFSFETCGA